MKGSLVTQLSLMLILVSIASACGTGTAKQTEEEASAALPGPVLRPTASGSGPVTMLSPFVNQELEERLDDLSAKFQEVNPEIQVEIEIVSDEQLADRIGTGQELPDVILLPAEYVADMAASDMIDIGLVTAVLDEMDTNKFFPGALEQVKAGGDKVLAIPYYATVQGLWYRKSMLEAAGLEPPASMEEILSVAETLSDPDAGVYGIALPGIGDPALLHHAVEHLALAAGVKVFGNDGTPQFADEAFVQVLQLYAELRKLGPPDPITMAEARDMFLNGQCGMILDSTMLPQTLAGSEGDSGRGGVRELGRDLGFISAPGGASHGYTLALAVRKDAGREAVRSWINHMMFDGYLTQAIPSGYAPTVSSKAAEWMCWKTLSWFGFYETSMPEDLLVGLEEGPRWDTDNEAAAVLASRLYAGGLIPQAMGRVLNGEMTAEEAAVWLQSEAQSLQ